MFHFHKDRLKLNWKLGKGRFGKISPYQKHSDDRKWVVKTFKAENSDALVACLPEVILGMSCDHPNVVPIKGYFIEKNEDNEGYNLYIKLPRMKGTLLEDFYERKEANNSYSEKEIVGYFYSLVCGVEYLHNKKIFHGDVRPESLLLDHNGVLKIGDIGISKHVGENPLMTAEYSAPELLNEFITKEVLRKGDIWSLGVVILGLCCFDTKLLDVSLPKDKIEEMLKEIFESLEGKYTSLILSLLQRILSFGPEERPGMGLIRNELEKNFPDILGEIIMKDEKKAEMKYSDEQSQEIFGKYEAEIKQLKKVVQQLEVNKTLALPKAKDEEESKTSHFEEQIRILEQRNKDIGNYFEAQIKEKTKAFEKDIKVFMDRLLQSDIDKKKLDAQVADLQSHLQKYRPPNQPQKKESHGKAYEENLQKVVSQLNSKWNKWYTVTWFEFEIKDKRILQIGGPKKNVTDEILNKLAKNLLAALEENDLLNLYGLNFFCPKSPELTDKSVEAFASMLSNQSLQLQYLSLSFSRCENLTDKSVKDLTKAFSIQAYNLKNVELFFNGCTKLTDSSLESIAQALAQNPRLLRTLDLSFASIPGMTDKGFEAVARAAEIYHSTIETLKLSFQDCPKIASEKKTEAMKRFAKVPYFWVS